MLSTSYADIISFTECFSRVCCLAPYRELFVKLLKAEEENLLEGKSEMAGDLREGEGGGIAAISSLRAIRLSTTSPSWTTDSCIANFPFPFLSGHYPPANYYYAGKWQVSACLQPGERTNSKKAQQMPG